MPLVINTLWDYPLDFNGIFPRPGDAVGTAVPHDPSPDLPPLRGTGESDGPSLESVQSLLAFRRLMRSDQHGWKAGRQHPRQCVEYRGDHATDGSAVGQGQSMYANGDRHTGQYKGGKRHGNGRLSFHSGERYVGEFQHGLRQGEGSYFFASGDVYVGPQSDNQPDGVGYFYCKKIDRWDRTEFRKGEFVRDVKVNCGPPAGFELPS
eukprot:TRINITY_DN28637_c0_g1_i1.p1 TRINITY_DN28637_c0_g1~~TRINITY_DN28637_c0_g1_i1.p1  ORF type:complete len:207 (+),score=14.85 TRINITY_DN28637_c0_g1_i1:127-747(+)